MALLKAKDLRQHSSDELGSRISNLRKEHFELIQKNMVGQLDRPHRLRQIRREIAQILTVINEKSQDD